MFVVAKSLVIEQNKNMDHPSCKLGNSIGLASRETGTNRVEKMDAERSMKIDRNKQLTFILVRSVSVSLASCTASSFEQLSCILAKLVKRFKVSFNLTVEKRLR